MHLSTIRIIMDKELREVLRDRRTLLLMIGVPVFLYPALFVLMEQVLLFGRGSLQSQPVQVGVHYAINVGHDVGLRNTPDLRLLPIEDPTPEMIREGRFDAIILVETRPEEMGDRLEMNVLFDASRDRSIHARSVVMTELEALNDSLLATRLEEQGLPREFARPILTRARSVATPRGLGGATLGRLLPMILVIMTVLGAFHPAIDIAAGERERRTLEPLLTTSAPGGSIVFGKYLAVAAIAFTAAALNLSSMLLTLNAGIFQFASAMNLQFQLPVGAVLLILLLLLLLALLFSALFLGVAVQAQSFREAQTALTPIYVVSFLPAVVTMAPGIDFSVALALVPIAGVAMLFRALMSGDPVGLAGFVAVGATIAYAALALSFAARAFAREDVLLGDDENAEVQRGKRGPWWNRDGLAVPSARSAVLFTALVGLLFFYLGLAFARYGERGIFASQWLLLALPAAIYLGVGRFRWREVLSLRPAPPIAFASAVLIILGGLPIGWLIAWVQTFFLELPAEYLAAMEGLLRAEGSRRMLWLLLVVAVTPAICEEVVFRGILLRSLLGRVSAHVAILGSSFIFGLFHLSFESAIRLLPTMFLGMLLAIVVTRTRSIFPAVLMHFVNNATAVLLISRPELQRLAIGEGAGPNWWLVIAGVVALFAGLRLLPDATPGRPDGEAAEMVPAVRPG